MGQRIPKTVLKKHLRGAEPAAVPLPAAEEGLPAPKKPRAPKAVAKKRGPAPGTHIHSGREAVDAWLAGEGFQPFKFQEDAWAAISAGKSGLVNAPTGFGKTFSIFLGAVIRYIDEHPGDWYTRTHGQLYLIWITPLRALAKDIHRAMEAALAGIGLPWRVGVRNGDTSLADRAQQKAKTPEVLIITPESLHLLIATKGNSALFRDLRIVCVDEWHELLGSKRGVQVELALGYLKEVESRKLAVGSPPEAGVVPEKDCQLPTKDSQLQVWALSATIGNLEEAMVALLGDATEGLLIRADLQKKIALHTVLPETVERFPWAGHLGIKMIHHVLPVIHASRTTLLFVNVRSAAEMWYQALLAADPSLAGVIALHHSAINGELRMWVEEQLHDGTLKVVVCTSSLDLGVDFRPVDTVIQVGSPKGVARFLQRAGRAGHQPDAVSNIYFVPTHSLEIIEAVALKTAYEEGHIEQRVPVTLSYDVLIQFMVTRAVGEGFAPEAMYREIVTTNAFADLTWDEWEWMLAFITTGGQTLHNYEDYHKVVVEDGIYKVTGKKIAMRHRMGMGTIVSDAMMRVKFVGGGFVGTIEENFISRLKPGDAFILAGRRLELVNIRDMDAFVRKSTAKSAIVPAWNGGRLPLSASLGTVLRRTYELAAAGDASEPLLKFLEPLIATQKKISAIPRAGEVLVEKIETRDGFHLFVYPFEGRLVHQAMAALLAYRIGLKVPISFSIAMNDYGFELHSEQPIPVDDPEEIRGLFSTADWYTHLQRSLNAAELGRRKFRDIATIAGLIFTGYPGEHKKQRHLQASSGLIYDVLMDAEPTHLLLQQAFTEVLAYEVEADRLYAALERISSQQILLSRPASLTPFCFPIKVDSLREQLSSEKLEDRIKRMQESLSKL